MRKFLNWKIVHLFVLFFVILVLGVYSQTEQSVKPNPGESISAVEDLMREHGVLDRVLLIYEQILRRMEDGRKFPVDSLSKASHIVRSFIENYHEKLEEDYLFPKFEKAGKFTDLTGILRKQHSAGRILTDKIIELANQTSIREGKNRESLVNTMHQFIRLYRPHKAREDTVLFPAIHQLIPQSELEQLSDTFEDKEQELFGKDGFEKMVESVAEIEKTLGIYDLSQFTPK
jgi:hemerythrin-like domain-containing protein